jgi:hypothetical protein
LKQKKKREGEAKYKSLCGHLQQPFSFSPHHRRVIRKKISNKFFQVKGKMASPLIVHTYRWCLLLLISFIFITTNAAVPTSPGNNNVTCSSVRSAYRARGLPDRDVPQSQLPIASGK